MPAVCFIGAGKMATAIASGLCRSKSGFPIYAYDPVPESLKKFETACKGTGCSTLKQAVRSADIVLLAVKPQQLADAVRELPSLIGKRLVISIVAGVPMERLTALTGTKRVIRVMPNTPALAGAGMTCIAPSAGVFGKDTALAVKIFSAVGKTQILKENLMDAVTGLSGSGPAYVLEFIMALADGGVYEGLPRAAAIELAAQTVFGTAKLAMESGTPLGELRNAVISPAGTTARGCMVLAENGFAAASAKAVIAAAEYSKELGKA